MSENLEDRLEATKARGSRAVIDGPLSPGGGSDDDIPSAFGEELTGVIGPATESLEEPGGGPVGGEPALSSRDESPEPGGTSARQERRLVRKAVESAAAVLAAAVTLAVVASASAFAYDRARTETIAPDISISGVAVGGLTREEAEAALWAKVAAVAGRKLYLTAADKTFYVALSELALDAGVKEAVDAAFEASRAQGMAGRLRRWFGGGGAEIDIPLQISPSREAVEKRVVASIAGEVNREPTEAAIEETSDEIVFRPPAPGVELEAARAADLVLAAAESAIDGRDPGIVRLPTREIPVREGAGVTTAILVRVREQRLYFYENATLSGVYKVSTGTPQYPTPIGTFKVIQKLVNPSWTNPAPDGWGKDMPAYIPPGPDNPLGTRALQLNVPGILIHGTQNVRALGSPASHGCIRMKMDEIEALFPKVPVGTPVFIRR